MARRVKYTLVLDARGKAPDLLGIQRFIALHNARAFQDLNASIERGEFLPPADTLNFLGPALSVLTRPGGTPFAPLASEAIPLLI